MTYKTKGTCSSQIDFDLKDGKVYNGCRGRNPCCPLETEIQDQTKKENRHRNLRIPSRLRRRMGPDFI